MLASSSFRLIGAASVLCCGYTLAGPVTYSESANGDLPLGSFGVALPTLVFDVGTNTVSGTSGETVTDGVVDWDSFAFQVPTGMEVVSGQLELTRHGTLSRPNWSLYRGSPDFRGGTFVDTLDPNFLAPPFPLTAVDSIAAVPLSAGTYNISAQGLSGLANSLDWGTYIFSFDVSALETAAVPEPASLTSVGLGAIGLAIGRRRKTRQRAA